MDRAAFDTAMMANALRIAARGLGNTAPNPSVGAVIADEATGEIISRGWTQPGGRPHAEADAIRWARGRARGATMYVTLEPCAHHGKTPPCADSIAAAGLSRVVVGTQDPDPRTAGKGIALLRAAGIPVTEGVLGVEAKWITLGHILRVTQGRPFVQIKMALDARGEIARGSRGRPVWVTGSEARARGHMLRAMTDAIIVGVQTVLDDDPELTCRLPGLTYRSPNRVILDFNLRTPSTAKVLPQSGDHARVWIASGSSEQERDKSAVASAGALVLTGMGQSAEPRVDILSVLNVLAVNGMTRVLVEGGPATWRSFLDAGVVDEAIVFHAHSGSAPADPDQIRERWLAGTPLALAERRKIGEDQEFVFRRP